MDIEKAFRRKEALEKRLARELKFGIPIPSEDRECPDAAYGQHGDPNWRGRCPYCDKNLGKKKSRLNTERRRNVFDFPRASKMRSKIEEERTFGEVDD
jgi:hypothetical protein